MPENTLTGRVEYRDGSPAPRVVVSTGAVNTVTDDDGRFSLLRQAVEGSFVVLTRPTGFTAAPWWQRTPEDDGEIVFVLDAEPQSLPYTFVHLTDTHMTVQSYLDGQGEGFGLYREGSLPAQLTDFLARLDALAPEAQSIMITGDLVDHGLAEEYEAYVEVLASSPVPTHVIPGNHDHMNGHHGSLVSRNDYLTNTGTPELYERYLGPRWYSFDVAGLHVVALDWHTHELGLDHETQNAWVKADLARLEVGSPYILLFHDQPNFSIVDELPWRPVAAFSGHWHTSRVVEVDGTLHVNSPTSFFASLDYSPPAFRRVTWDGSRITMKTQTLLSVPAPSALTDVSRSTFAASTGTSTDEHVLWQAGLAGAGHRQRVSVQGDVVFAGGQIEDRAAGSVEAFDLATGELLWRTPTSSAVKTTPAPAGDVVLAAEVSGDLTALDARSGEVVWRLPSSDPLRRFAWGAPTVASGMVYLGDQSDLRAVDVATGEVIWRRTDLSPHHNLVNHAAPLIVDELLVMGFWPTPASPIGLDARTGESVWEREPQATDTFFELKRLLIMGTAAFDPATDAVLMPAHGHTTVVDRATGRTRWVQPHEGGFSPATPLVTDLGYVVTVTGRGIRMLDRTTGETLWNADITGDAPFPMASYTKTPHPVIAPPSLVGDEPRPARPGRRDPAVLPGGGRARDDAAGVVDRGRAAAHHGLPGRRAAARRGRRRQRHRALVGGRRGAVRSPSATLQGVVS
ncbi:hypothetical protein GCM10025867_41290 [Frondihabitans sucicola]|uniref:Calcineurin-like phosphoesterase domain-containing protein n=1 Tax=Frondihabitans sucicola TaxID=1268041 RepID=A0ABM8GTV8_9MICO|nr:PQQ-binding-like beta-propeller repeat protein [Frondihabitans sucicola]BDZ51888.1 hypothetical protein GCM10025867_41290 [Frondihabitans sucicola]